MYLKTVNKLIKTKYPFLDLVRGEGYFYFSPSGGAEEKYALAIASLFSTSVYVYRTSDLTGEQWLEEADTIVKEINKYL